MTADLSGKSFYQLSDQQFQTISMSAIYEMGFVPRLKMMQDETHGIAATGKSSRRKIRIGIVGGRFGSTFQWHLDPDCEVYAVSEMNPQRRDYLKKIYQCDRGYETLDELIRDKNIDAVAVFTGAPDHAKHSITCMRAGKHVISAVPACTSLEDAENLLTTVKETGLTYMMAETSYYHQEAIAVRHMYKNGDFGTIMYTEAEYLHPGLETMWFDENGKSTWRHGAPPMHYPTHMTAFIVGITGERLTAVSCLGWTDNSPLFKGNPYNNNHWNEIALFRTNKGNAARAMYFKRAAVCGAEKADWYGEKMSFFSQTPLCPDRCVVKAGIATENDDGGFSRSKHIAEKYEVQEYWKTDMLPESLRIASGHGGSHTFLTHEFIDALVNNRTPAIDIYEALAYTVPGIVAHQSAVKGGEQLKIPSFDPEG